MKTNSIVKAFALMFFGATLSAQIPNYVPQNGLVGWWPFNGNANDESGNGNHGTVNGAALTADRFGNVASAFSFNGTTNSISIPNIAGTGNSARSIFAWIKTTSSIGKCIVGTGGLSVNAGVFNLVMGYGPGSSGYPGKIGLMGGNFTTGGNDYYPDSGPSVNDDLWHNVGVTHDGINTLKIYIDGLLVNSTTITYNTTGQLNFIGFNNFSGSQWDGLLDDIGIWNRALTQQEITTLYNSCQVAFSTQPSSQTINQSQTAQFSALSSDPSATYQWQSDVGFGFQNLNNVGQYSGVNTGTLFVANVNQNNNNQPFRCIVNVGTCSDTSQTATLNVCAALTSQPANQTAAANQNVQFTATSSDPSATYQWQSDVGFGFQNLNNVGQYSGVNTGTLSVSNVSASNNNQPFRCVVSAGSCTDTSQTAVLSVNGNVSIEGHDDPDAFSIFPNPSRTQVTIYFGKYANKKGHSVQIVNALGQTMYSTAVSQEASLIDVSAWSANGLYYVQILDANKEILETRKLVVQ